MQLTIRRALGPLTALALGCGGDSTGVGNVDDGEFRFEVTGVFAQTVTGNAYWASGADAEGGFAIDLSNGEHGTVLGRVSPTAPAVGTYQLGSTDDADTPPEQFLAFAILSSGIAFCGSQSGTMQITSTGAHIHGTFTANVGCFDQASNSIKDAVITGEFDAVGAPQQ